MTERLKRQDVPKDSGNPRTKKHRRDSCEAAPVFKLHREDFISAAAVAERLPAPPTTQSAIHHAPVP